MPMICTEITEWIEEKISRPIAEWEERQWKECKKRPWYDPRRWLCWFVTRLVKVIRWVVVTVVKMVITIVCRLVSRVIAILVDIVKFFYLLIKALVTWDKCVLQEALSELADALLHVVTILYVVVDPFVDSVNRYRLRNYVRGEIEERFADQPELIDALKHAFHVDHGVFGFRVTCQVYRMFVDSQASSERYPDVPNLYGLHRDGLIDLYQLAGFTPACALTTGPGWYRPRPQTAKYPFAGGGSGDAIPPSLREEELREYIDSAGEKGPHFRIYAIHPWNLDTRLDTTAEKARRLGLIFRFDRKEVGVLDEDYIKYSSSVQPRFLIQELDRHDRDVDIELARMDLCSPVAVAVFGFQNRNHRGWTTSLQGTTECAAHDLSASTTSGLSFIDDIPDEVRRYVLVHELGHYFGLCHVDGFSRIMVSGSEGQGDAVTVGSFFGFLAHGGPRFTLDEAKQVWRYILTHFPTECLLEYEDQPETPGPVIVVP